MADELQLCRPSRAMIPALRAYVPAALNLGTRPGKGMGLTFASFLRAGAVPPYSDFLLAVLRHYRIRLAHLTANSITILSVFAHLCVEWLGVPPSLDLFRSYYTCRRTYSKPKRAVGSCHFLLLKENKSTTDDDEFILVQSRVCFKGWHDKWLYIDDGGLKETAEPTACAVSVPSWSAPVPGTPELNALRERVAKLRRGGLTGAKVMHDVVKRRLAPLRKDPKVFPEADGVLDDAQIWSSMLNLFGEKAAVAIMVTGDEEDGGGGEEEGDGCAGRRRRGRRACWPAKKKMRELPPAATEVTPPLGSGSSSAGAHGLRRRKRPPPAPAAPSALRRSSRLRSVGDVGAPQQTTAPPRIEAGEEEEELKKLKTENTQLLQDLKTEKDQCRATYDRARAALRQINMMHPELPAAADDSGDSSGALFGRVVDRLELLVRTLPDRFLESARGVALDTAELVLGHCVRLHPQLDLQMVVNAVVEEEELPDPETDEAQARVLEGARQIADQCVQVEAPFGDDGEDTSAATGGQGGDGSSASAAARE